ncbi:MAG TPA: E2/UBC family protein [Candidatus Didemnitutus sp.]
MKPLMKGREIAKLVEEHPDQTKVEQLTAAGPKPVGLDEEVPIVSCDEFKVIRCNINAGFQAERLERELSELRVRGANVSVVGTPVAAVIYHDVPVRAGLPAGSTDVLVKVPAGYPGGIIDNAFLPEGSPLLSCTPGGEQQVESFGGRAWKQKSIHPYTGNGIPWNKDRHGFHTYYTELVNWLNAGK